MTVEVSLFGQMNVRNGEVGLESGGFGGRKPRELLAILALEPGRVRVRDELAEELWDARPPGGYVTTLQGYVCVLRRKLAHLGACRWLATTGGGYLLDAEEVRVDLDGARRLLLTGEVAGVLDTLDLDAAGLLPEDSYAPWACRVRDEWNTGLAEAAWVAAETANTCAQHLAAGRLARASLARAPYSEGAVRELMTALVAQDRETDALQEFMTFRSRLRSELGVDPQPATSALYAELLRSRPDSTPPEVPMLLRLLREVLDGGDASPTDDRETWHHVGRLLLSRAG
ncbi:MAG: AfsR/SARP family transcriptional regulator [Nocardioides sp.]